MTNFMRNTKVHMIDPLIKLIYDGGDEDKEVDEEKVLASLALKF